MSRYRNDVLKYRARLDYHKISAVCHFRDGCPTHGKQQRNSECVIYNYKKNTQLLQGCVGLS